MAPGLSCSPYNRDFLLMFAYRNHHEMIQISTNLCMMVTASHSTLQTPSKGTHCQFTPQHCHSPQQIQASIRNSATITGPKLFVAWIRHSLNNCCNSKAIMVQFILLHSHSMDPKLSQGLMMRPFEFGMQARVSRCSNPCEVMMA